MKNLFVIPTMGMSTLYKRDDLGTYHIGPFDLCLTGDLLRTNQYVYVTNDEDINENDYIITKDGRLVQVSYLLSEDLIGGTKVVMTNDLELIESGIQQIGDLFFRWFVKNPSCEVVSIYKNGGHYDGAMEFYIDVFYGITIPKEERKKNWSESDERVRIKEEKKLREAFDKIYDSIDFREFDFASFKLGVKWEQEQNKKKYSEEEVLILLHERDVHNMHYPSTFNKGWKTPKEWLELIKNK
jgi:hypothetical protein